MRATEARRVVVAAGGLGTRVHRWARFIPKEFYPVDGRPGIVHLLEEIAALGPAEAVVVYHPYYERFAAWARQVLSEHGQGRYTHLTGHGFGAALPAGMRVSFVPQRGPYADLTSVVNGADHLGTPARLYVAFADNLYRGPNPLIALRDAPADQVVVLASRYRSELAASHGVITTTGRPGQRLMTSLAEKPSPGLARILERRYGRGNLFLLEGRARLTAAFTGFARTRLTTPGMEPKLSLTIAAYAASHPVHVIETRADVINLGTFAAPEPASDACPQTADGAWAAP